MEKNMRYAAQALLGLCCAALLPLAHAMPVDTLQPFVAYSITRDSNLFRLPSNLNPQADTYQIYTAGTLLDWKYGRQEVTGQLSVNKVRYNRFTFLDTQGHNIQLQWNWQSGRQWSGTLTYGNQVSQVPFTNINQQVTNTNVSNKNAGFKAHFLLAPFWRLNAGVSQNQVNYDAPQLQGSNQKLDKVEGGMDYLARDNSRVGLTYAYTRGVVPGTTYGFYCPFPVVCTEVSDNNFRQQDLRTDVSWNFSGKTKLYGYVGLTRRTYDNSVLFGTALTRNFTGVTGMLNANWQMTGITSLSGQIYRYLGPVQGLSSYGTYVVYQGAKLGPVWQPTPKTSVAAQGFVERQDFRGHSGATTPLPTQPTFTFSGLSLTLTWQPFISTTVGAVIQTGSRSSNLPNLGFRHNSVNLNVQVVF